MPMIFYRVVNIGTHFRELRSEKRNIRLTNSVAIGLIFVVILLLFARTIAFGFDSSIVLGLLANALVAAIPLILNHYGRPTLSRIILCWSLGIVLLADIYIVLKSQQVVETSLYLGFRIFQVAFSGFPLLLFNLSEWKRISVAYSVPILLIIFYDPILNILGVGYEQRGLSEATYHYNLVRSIAGAIIIGWSLYSLKRIIERQERQNASLIAELAAKNKVIEKHASKKIETLNQALIEQLEQVSKAERKYRMLFEEASDGIILFGAEGNLLDVNPYLCALLGYQKSDLLGMDYRSLLDQHELEKRPIDFEQIRSGIGVTAERTFLAKGGIGIPVENRISKVGESRFLGVSRDIRERKNHEQELDRSNQALNERLKELKTLYEISRLVNDKTKDKETVLQEIANVLPNGWRYPEICRSKIFLQNKVYASLDYRDSDHYQKSNIMIGGEEAGSIIISYLTNPNNKDTKAFLVEELSMLNSIARLIQIYIEEKEKDEALKRTQANLFATINNTEFLVWSVDRDRKLITFNKQFQLMLKKHADIDIEIGERVVRGHIDEPLLAQAARWDSYYLQALSGNALSFEEVTFGRNYNYTLNPIVENDQVIGVSVFGHDVTEVTDYRKSLEEKVSERTNELHKALEKEKELATLKTRFASLVSHEFRTPLATIRLTVNQIKRYRNRLTPQSIDEKVDIVLEQVDHMAFLLEDVLSLGRTEDPKLQIRRAPVDLSDFFETIKGQIESVNQKTEHQIDCILKLANPVWETDPDLIRNIFSNLLSNAIKFSPESKLVRLTGTEQNGTLEFQVKDEGIGIKEDELNKIFLPFDRGSNVDSIPGTGLGLSIARKAVELLKGTISVSSTLGQGTTFSISFPRNS
jgi:PAS domain S-box-containing protein